MRELHTKQPQCLHVCMTSDNSGSNTLCTRTKEAPKIIGVVSCGKMGNDCQSRVGKNSMDQHGR